MSQFTPTLHAFVVALLATTVVVLLRHVFFVPVLGITAPVMLFLFAVVAASWIGGFRGGLFATVLGTITGTFLRGLHVPSTTSQWRLVLFVAIGGMLSWLISYVRSAQRHSEERRRTLEQEVLERRRAEATLAAEISRREIAEAALLDREERIRLAIESAEIGTWDLNPLNLEIKSSSRCKAAFGFPPEAEVGLSDFLRRIHPDDQAAMRQAMQSSLNPVGDGGYDVEYRTVWPDGTIRWVIAKGLAFFEGDDSERRATRFIGTVMDVTGRREADERVRISDGRLRAIMDNTLAVIYVKDMQGRYLMINRRFEELFNVSQQQFIGRTDADIFPPDVVAMVRGHDRQVRDTKEPLECEEIVPQKDGPHVYVSVKFPITDATGAVIAVGGISTDITDRKAAEELVCASESRLRGILDNTPAVISLKDLQGRYALVNRGWEHLFGVSKDHILGLTNEELLSKTLSRHMSREIADQFAAIDRKVIETGDAIEFEDPMQHSDDPRIFVTVKFPIRNACEEITGVGGISIDITERRRALDSLASEQELLRHTIEIQDQERQLVAYEIHDGLVQYATGALMRVDAMRDQVGTERLQEEIDNVLDILRSIVAEGRRLINGIRTPVLDDSGVVAAVQHLIDEEDRAHVQVEFIKDENLGRLAPKIKEAIYRITQEALTNIRKHSQSNKVRVQLGRRSGYVHLEIKDWGVGFTPPSGFRGVHGLKGMTERARIAGGRCQIESAPGEGTKIEVALPCLGD